jgi:hypothetical protein
MTDDTKKRKLEAALSAARATVALLEAELDDVTQGVSGDDPLLDVDQVQAEFGAGRDALKAAAARGELELLRGARGKLMISRSAVRRWIESRPAKPRKAAPASNLDDWDREAERALRAVPGGRR